MIDLELELVSENPSWIAVLKAYQKAQEELAEQQAQAPAKSTQAEKINSIDPESTGSVAENVEAADAVADSGESAADEDFDEDNNTAPRKRASRWVQRVTSLPGFDAAELSKIHGRLIAYDLLKCDLAGRSDGMVYQLTTSGKTIISRYGNEALEGADRSAA